MTQIIVSPVPRWPGTVQIPDYLTFIQMLDFQAAIEAAQLLKDAGRDQYNQAILPGLCACVEKWELKGLPERVIPDNFPATPKVSSMRLITWLMGEIVKLYQEADEAPNA